MRRDYEDKTVLGRRLRELRLTIEEFVSLLEKHARNTRERGTLSARHAQRLASGEFNHTQIRPATARLIESYLGTPIEELLSNPNESPRDTAGKCQRNNTSDSNPLAKARRRLGYTQESFAAAVGVELSTVGRWKRGQHKPHAWTRRKIAQALKISIEQVAEMLEPSASAPDHDQKGSMTTAYWSNAIFADRGMTAFRDDRRVTVNRRSFLSVAAVAAVDMGVATEYTASIAGGDAEPLGHVQTTYEVDLTVASLVDRGAKNTLLRWTENQGNPVARVNATGILAKIPDQHESARVVHILRNDDEVRRLYLTAVTMRTCSIEWADAARFVENPVGFPLATIAVERFLRETLNPRDVGARWCSARMLQELSPVIGR